VVEWYPRDPFTVWIVKLVNGTLPPRGGRVDALSPLHYFDLGDLASLSERSRESDENVYGLPIEEVAQRRAASLRDCGDDLLRGDLSLLLALEQRIRDRAKGAAIVRRVTASPVAVILPNEIREQVLALPEWRMGAHRVTVTLADGRMFGPVDVAWGSEVVRVFGFESVPFAGAEVVAVADASGTRPGG
jgi:hypothetical protein